MYIYAYLMYMILIIYIYTMTTLGYCYVCCWHILLVFIMYYLKGASSKSTRGNRFLEE